MRSGVLTTPPIHTMKEKLKKFFTSPWGIVALVLIVLVLVMAYASRIPGLGALRRLGAMLPGSDAKRAAGAA